MPIIHGVSFKSWLQAMDENRFLTAVDLPAEPVLKGVRFLKPDLTIVITREVIERLREQFSATQELGGLFLAVPQVRNRDTGNDSDDRQQRQLRIEHIVFMQNRSPTPDRQFTWNFQELWMLMERATGGYYNNQYYLPIFFHTHPLSAEKITSLPEALLFLKQSFSASDKRFSTQLFPASSDVIMGMPCAVVINMPDRALLVAFYGGRIAPESFDGLLSRLAGRSAREVIDECINIAKTTEFSAPSIERSQLTHGLFSTLRFLERLNTIQDRSFSQKLVQALVNAGPEQQAAAAAPFPAPSPPYLALIQAIGEYRIVIPPYEPPPIERLVKNWKNAFQNE